MKCEKCGKTATSHVTSVKNGKKEEHHYCSECFSKLAPFGNIAKGLNLPFIVENVDAELEEEYYGEDGLDENGVPYEYSCSSDEEACCGMPIFLENMVMSFAGDVFGGRPPFLRKQTENDETPKDENEKSVKCAGCGLSLKEVSKTQKAGCAKCYHTFDGVLLKKYQRFGNGRHYNGKDYSPKIVWNDIEHMQNELNIAVKNQNFELAARLRDGMNKLQKEKAPAE